MRSLIITCILIGLAAVAAPSVFTHYAKEPRRAEVASSEGEAEPAPEGEEEGRVSHSRQVEIEAERDGHFYVEAEINNAPVRLIVDTGATVVALRASDAAAAGIRPVKSEFTNPVQTANGTTMAAETTLDRVSVDDIEINNVRALVIPDDQLSLSLLGGSFLNGVERFEVAGGTLIIEN